MCCSASMQQHSALCTHNCSPQSNWLAVTPHERAYATKYKISKPYLLCYTEAKLMQRDNERDYAEDPASTFNMCLDSELITHRTHLGNMPCTCTFTSLHACRLPDVMPQTYGMVIHHQPYI
jgi:hypothetical protein